MTFWTPGTGWGLPGLRGLTEYGEKIGLRWVISVKNVKGFILPFCSAASLDCGAGVTMRPDGVMVGVVTLLFALVLVLARGA